MRRLPCSTLCFVAVLLLAGLAVRHVPVSAQAGEGSLTASVYGCPPGVTADTASPDTCVVLTEGFGLNLSAIGGDAPVQTLGQAAFDGTSYTWSGLQVPQTYLVAPARPPGSPYTSHLVVGDGLAYDERGNALAPLTTETPSITLVVYNLAPAEGRGPVSTEPTAPEPRRDEDPGEQPAPAAPTTGGGTDLAQTDTELGGGGRPAVVYAGTCGDLGDAIADLTGLAAPEGDAVGAEDAVAVETSFSRLDLALDEILAAAHVVAVFDADGGEAIVACGAVGGVAAEDGSLAVGLHEVDGSGVAGVAYMAPDGERTTVTVFLAEGLEADAGTPEAD